MAIADLSSRANIRMQRAFRDSTSRAYNSMFRVFLAFCVFARVTTSQISIDTMLAFLEFLVFNGTSNSAVANYISALKAKFILLRLDTTLFDSPRIKYYTKALRLQAPFKVTLKSVIDIPLLNSIALHCDSMFMGQIFKAAYLLAFFSFLRISNLVPHSISAFNPLEQLCRADIIFSDPGAHILVKWSKTLQSKNTIKIIKIPALPSLPICPVTALRNLLRITPQGKNKLLFQIKCHHLWVPLTDTRLHKNLKQILAKLQLHTSNITFHTFRRSGATLAFNSSVPIQDIQSQGTWTSDCVWSYITQNHQASDKVALAFRSLLLP